MLNRENSGGGYCSGGLDHSENVKLCMRYTQTDSFVDRPKYSARSLYKPPSTPYANRSSQGFLGSGPFEPHRSPGIPSYCSMKDPYLDDYFSRKFNRMLSPSLPLRQSELALRNASAMNLRPSSSFHSQHGDGVRGETLYKVAVTTADAKGAGTSIPVYVSIKGDFRNLPRTRLKKLARPKKKKSNVDPSVKFSPGSTQVFPIRCQDLGEIESILIEHDGIEPKDSWLLQGIEVMNCQSKRIWMFPCNHWLSLYKEDGRVSRELFAYRSIRTKYEIVMVTGDIPNADTNSPVYITLFGRTGTSPQLLLKKDEKPMDSNGKTIGYFGRNQSTRFVLNATCVGPLTKIRLRLEDANSQWYVERCVITDLRHSDWRYYFSIRHWFSKEHGLSRDIRGSKEITGINSRVTYKISIYTGSMSTGGTRARVFLQLFGVKSESPMIQPSHEGLAPGSVYRCEEELRGLGQLQRIKVGHDNTGESPRWFLDKVIVNDCSLDRVYVFPCGQWFSDEPGESLVRVLQVAEGGAGSADSSFKYELRLTTGDRNKAQTTSRVYAIMHGPETKKDVSGKSVGSGSEANSGQVWIEGAQYTRGRTDVAQVVLQKCLSPLTKLQMGIAPAGKKPDWFLEDVVVHCTQTGVEQTFICGNWLSGSLPGSSCQIDLVEDINRRKYKQQKESWLVTIVTSDIKEAGTGAKITLVMYSKTKKTEEIFVKCEGDDRLDRGSTRQFKTELIDLEGLPYKLRVQNDNSSSNPAWHLDKIVMKKLSDEQEYDFICGRWLSTVHDDHLLVREIPATGPLITEPGKLLTYRVQIYTGNKQFAGTDANVFINIFGSIGDTGDRVVVHSLTNVNKFERGKMDEFMIEAVDLGEIYKIRLGHDGKLAGSGWFVDKVIVSQENDSRNSMTFRCNCWFDTEEGDGLIVREFTGAAMLGKVSYKVEVKTGTEVGAGTDANVFLTIYGSTGDTGDIPLKSSDNSINKFEAGKTDTFHLESEDIGQIQSIRLSQDCKGTGCDWLVDEVIVLVPDKGLKYKFVINQWLNKKRSSVNVDVSSMDKIEKTIPYQITVFTGDVKYAGTDADVFIQIYGRENKTDVLPLTSRTNTFEIGAEDVFKLNAIDVGTIQKIRIGHNGKKPGAGWYLSKVLIEKLIAAPHQEPRQSIKPRQSLAAYGGGSRSLSLSSTYTSYSVPRKSVSIRPGVEEDMEVYWFFCGRWLAVDEDDGLIVRELLPKDNEGRPLSDLHEIKYHVDVKTGSAVGAGTDANVFLTIYGANGDSGERMLRNTVDKRGNKFEDGQIDSFVVPAIDLGELVKIKIRHDNSGAGAAWLLDYVTINSSKEESFDSPTHSGDLYLFPCYRWLARNEDDGLISRDIFAASGDIVNKWKQNKLDNKDLRMDQENRLETYKINVYTTKRKFAGTDANVYIILFGEDQDSGMVPLKTSTTSKSNKFGSGSCDEFIVKLQGLGDLKKLKVGHDGAGGASNWHLEKIEVKAIKLGKIWVFPCNEWINMIRGQDYAERELYPHDAMTQKTRPKVTYEVVTYTSNVRGAGTDANIYIQLYGRNDCTEKTLLASTKVDRAGKFKKAARDVFYVEMEEVEEPLLKCRVGHDGSGIGAGWHLDRITVKRVDDEHQNSVEYLFPCGRWLAQDEDDRAIERELVPSRVSRIGKDGHLESDDQIQTLHQKKEYLIKVKTGNETGINSNVFLKIYGENGDSGERQLTHSLSHTDKFERNNVDEFLWEAVDLGRIFSIDIRHDNSGLFKKDWLLDYVEVVDTDGGETYRFSCEKWLSKNKEDKKIKRTFYVVGYMGPKKSSISGGGSRFTGSSYGGSTDSLNSSNVSGGTSQYQFEDEEDGAHFTGPMMSYIVTVKTGAASKDMGSKGPIWVRFYGPAEKKTTKMKLHKLVGTEFIAGSKETISLDGLELDSLTQIEVGNEGVDEASGWYLESIVVELPTKGKRYNVKCGCWISRFHGERKPNRIFVITEPLMAKFNPKIPYSLKVYTGDCPDAGTSSTLFIKLFGTEGASNVYTLEKMEDRFDRGSRDIFIMDMDNVGDIKRIRIQNDGLGDRAHWFLEKLEIRNENTMKEYAFEYNDYLSSNLGQHKQLSVDLTPLSEDAKYVTYLIRVKTSDVKGASFSGGNVFIKLFGDLGESGDFQLKKYWVTNETGKPFQQNKLDEFQLENVLSLGELNRCQVWHEDKSRGGKWHLDSVEVIERSVVEKTAALQYPAASGAKWTFPCGKWLSVVEDDCQILRDLLCTSSVPGSGAGISKRPKTNVYELTVVTGDKKEAGMPHNAWFRFQGNMGYSDIYEMKNDPNNRKFLRGAADTKKLETKYIGELRELEVGAFLSTDGMSHQERWYCHEIRVRDEFLRQTFVFEVRQWIPVLDKRNREEGLLLSVSRIEEDAAKKKSKEMQKAGLVKYEVVVITGDELRAGTNANVFLTMNGSNGIDSGRRPLIQKGRDLFERKQQDKFIIECLDLGQLESIKIEHDNTGLSSDWFLECILITNLSNKQTYKFECHDWLSKFKGDGKLWKVLTPAIG